MTPKYVKTSHEEGEHSLKDSPDVDHG
ncbi:hypothetical protein PPL_09806 [Heterostelium album PN500]|uniref:Uncharacterized protein n=1 Tax=Heterostelium pallidum (strain ATCC 26659 / Pp 5 / PN500) TaxID=670386 RepID=D3BP43_HETP5|nr:hypothetical protein PPL_09806 [Heterostelium album PN500]